MEPVLRPTYGVILYQEQVMQIAQVLAGYTLGAADILRRAMGKKKPEEMAKQREIFCKGAANIHISTELANHIFDLMEKFAGYGFNKSHSASYALIAYQTAWLKAHYPAAFMAAVLSSDMDRTEKIIILLDECQIMKLHVSPPDINKSEYYFKVLSDQHLMYGLGAIKGVGEAAIENIIAARQQGGAFKDLFDFCKRVDLRKMNKRVLEALIKSGCFDGLGTHRAMLIASLPHALQYAEQAMHNQMYGQHDLLSTSDHSMQPNYIKAVPWPDEIQLQGEKETLGFYLTGHPLRRYLNELSQFTTCRIVELHPSEHKNVRVAGIVTHIRTRQTKRGDRIGIFKLDDGTTQIEIVCFSEAYQKYRSLLADDQIIIIEGDVTLDDFNHQPRIIARELLTLEQARDRFAKHLRIHITATESIDVSQFKQILAQYAGGNCAVMIRYFQEKIQAQAEIRLGKHAFVKPCEDLLKTLTELSYIKELEFVY